MLRDEDTRLIGESVARFLRWLEVFGFTSYDQFDFWGSRAGVFARRLYYRQKYLAAPLMLTLQLLESFLPRCRALFAARRRFAIGDAHFVLGFANLYRRHGEPGHLEIAAQLVEEILASATRTPSGIGWGYPYTWVTRRAEYPPRTPFITVTPYCFNAILSLHELTGAPRLLEAAAQSAAFAAFDLHESRGPGDEIASGYGPGDRSRIVNANAYRAALLLEASRRFGNGEYRDKALGNLRFVLNQQLPDGAWYYSAEEPFIDHFHTCFVLKNLLRAFHVLGDARVLEAVQRGYAYYRRNLFRPDGTPRHFAKATHSKFRQTELYDYAESIALGPLLEPAIPGALSFAADLARQAIARYQLADGHFVTRVTTLHTRNTVPYLRWPQAQVFHALTTLLPEAGPRNEGADDAGD